jgi:uncharacterized protein involved in outer membrane biogenesis
MKITENPKLIRKLKIGSLAAAIILSLYTVTGFLVLPAVIKSVLVKKLSEKLHRQVVVEKVRLNPYALSANVKGFVIRESEGSKPLASFEKLYVNMQALSAVKRVLIFKEIKISAPYFNVIRIEEGHYNFSDILSEDESAAGGKGESESPNPDFTISNVVVTRGTLEFADRPESKEHRIEDIQIEIPFISSAEGFADTWAELSLRARVNGAPLFITGKARPFSRSCDANVDAEIKDLGIPHYVSYIPAELDYNILSGYLAGQAKIVYSRTLEKQPSMTISGGVTLKSVEAVHQDGRHIFTLPEAKIAAESFDLASMNLHLSELSFQRFSLNLWRDEEGRLNPKAPVAKKIALETRKDEGKDKRPLLIEIDGVKLAEGKVTFSDFFMEKPYQTTLNTFNLNVSGFSSAPNTRATFRLTARAESGEAISASGDISIDPFSSQGTLELTEIPVEKYSPYYSDYFLFDIEDAILAIKTGYRFTKGEREPEIVLSETSGSIGSLKLKRKGEAEAFLILPMLSVNETEFDLQKKQLRVGELTSERATLLCRRYKDGRMNLDSLFSPGSNPEVKPAGTDEESNTNPWQFTLGKALLKGYTVIGEDRMVSKPVILRAEGLDLALENISTVRDAEASVSLSSELIAHAPSSQPGEPASEESERGKAVIQGAMKIDPVQANLRVNLRDLELEPLQSYVPEDVKIRITGAKASASGNLRLGYSESEGLGVSYKGDASLSDVSIIDSTGEKDFLNWKALELKDMDVGNAPAHFKVQNLGIHDFFAFVRISPEGKLNILEVLPGKNPDAQAPPETRTLEDRADQQTGGARLLPVTIDQVVLSGGHIDFADNRIKPRFAADLSHIEGSVSGFSSEKGTRAQVDLRGKLGGISPLEIKGEISPLDEELFADLTLSFKDIDMTRINPYARKYVGYTIEKGDLQLDMQYQVVKKKLDSRNNIIFDQLTLGDRVDSPDATTLPIKFAVSLLKNRKGVIELGIPVSGQTDDPEFNFGEAISRAIKNFFTRVLTSPFTFLGSLFAGGKDLSRLEFDYGSSKLTEESQDKLQALVEGLYERPRLKLEIQGYADPEGDTEALRRTLLMERLEARKLKGMGRKDTSKESVDQVSMTPEEYERYLRLAFQEELSHMPDKKGVSTDLSAADMENLILDRIYISDDELRQLARERSTEVEKYILNSGKVEPERIFSVLPRIMSLEEKKEMKDSLIIMRLK